MRDLSRLFVVSCLLAVGPTSLLSAKGPLLLLPFCIPRQHRCLPSRSKGPLLLLHSALDPVLLVLFLSTLGEHLPSEVHSSKAR
mmetsp:Transcript_10939/g.35055  ORF Transcript_10939/g.35055 Transcript_10939/m.35055 type:complete len:84 (-) Transcript_10939:684-935(-)